MTWLNWSLNLHSGLRTIPHLILTHNTQEFDSINAYLICVMVHVQMWCVCSITCWSNLKIFFECFICFWKWFYTFVFLVFCSKFIFVFFFKNWFRGSFARSLRLRASRETSLREIKYFSISYRESRYCLTHEKCIFSVLYSICDSFSNSLHFPRTASLEPLSTQNHFSLKPLHSQACFLHFQLQGMFSKTFSSLLS